MKLCRFELSSAPGYPRTGFVYEGKVYETEGTNPIGVHEWNEVRLLAPIQRPASFRLFLDTDEFIYLNPNLILGSGQHVERPDYAAELKVLPCLAIVIGGQGFSVSDEQGDELILGLSLLNILISVKDKGARAYDPGIFLGPAITTPDELDDAVTEHKEGRRYHFPISLKVNNEELLAMDAEDILKTPSQLVSHASQSAPLHQGDLIGVVLNTPDILLDKGDDIQLFSRKLGALNTRLV